MCIHAFMQNYYKIGRYLWMVARSSCAYICDLQKAFDSVKYPVLLERLSEAGVNGKCWCLMKSWYEGVTCQVKVDDGMLSELYLIQRGVKQRPVLSPALFFVMDPLQGRIQGRNMPPPPPPLRD